MRRGGSRLSGCVKDQENARESPGVLRVAAARLSLSRHRQRYMTARGLSLRAQPESESITQETARHRIKGTLAGSERRSDRMPLKTDIPPLSAPRSATSHETIRGLIAARSTGRRSRRAAPNRLPEPDPTI